MEKERVGFPCRARGGGEPHKRRKRKGEAERSGGSSRCCAAGPWPSPEPVSSCPKGIFSHLPRLKHLRLNNNRLGALPRDLAACRGSLQYLNISNNLFRTFPQPVLQLANLQELHVQNNALRQLPKELFQGQSLKMFRANGNPLREPPSEVCAGGIQQILNYFNQLQHGSGQEDKRVKTMFLGASLAGKSTILLHDSPCVHHPTGTCHPCHQPPQVSAEFKAEREQTNEPGLQRFRALDVNLGIFLSLPPQVPN
uniref:Uncharacterized protein n=1 Tax=Anas zonorhyncha TaxID=75864 RepID=A0A8B9UZE2_9AVES